MHTVLIFSGGRRADALLLSATPDRLRVAIPGRGDTVEFRMVDGRWTTERGVEVEIGALMADDSVNLARFLPQTQAQTSAAV